MREIVCGNCGVKMFIPLAWKVTSPSWHCNPKLRETAIRPNGETR